ncbi:hypothetical protein FA95DRAFT_1612866, partial [Auriscalpium vulgare]
MSTSASSKSTKAKLSLRDIHQGVSALFDKFDAEANDDAKLAWCKSMLVGLKKGRQHPQFQTVLGGCVARLQHIADNHGTPAW